ncbi:MAG: hypothetical protein P1S46_09755 [bacterium]|nr:hypothetical protein [bacterium]MDT8396144.1 hypothetical protein [bacterium]
MNIWTSFFLVLSAVALAYPFLSNDGKPDGVAGSAPLEAHGDWNEEEVDLDLASGRLSRADHEIMGEREKSASDDVP